MRTVTTHVFTFDELSDDAKERARDWYRENALDYDWWDDVYEDAKNAARLLGIEIDKIHFSGFSWQGDGAQFLGTFDSADGDATALREAYPCDQILHNVAYELLEREDGAHHIAATVASSGRYCHEYATDIEVESDNADTDQAIRNALRDFMRWIYDALEAEYDYLLSNGSVDGAILCDEYEFTENGDHV